MQIPYLGIFLQYVNQKRIWLYKMLCLIGKFLSELLWGHTYSLFMARVARVIMVTFLTLVWESTATAVEVVHSPHPAERTAVAYTPSPEPQSAKLPQILDQLETLLETGPKNVSSDTRSRRVEGFQKQIHSLQGELRNSDTYVQADFEATLTHLRQHNLGDEMVKRHFEALTQYQRELATLQQNLQGIVEAKNPAQLLEPSKKALKHLKPLLRGKHPKFDPNHLPFNIPSNKVREPLETDEELKRLFPADVVKVASNHLTAEMLAKKSKAPKPEDLLPSESVQLTAEIQQLAQELENQPLKIFLWVHDNIQFAPTYGSAQGSAQCLETRLCNAADTASLLIALLRSAGIAAKFEYGTVQVSIEQMQNWVGGAKTPEAMMQIFGQGGIPATHYIFDGKRFMKFEHVWVRAWIDFWPSRGARHRKGDTWIPMDASFKQYEFTKGMDIQGNVPFDGEGFVEQITQAAQINEQEGWVSGIDQNLIQTTLENYQTQIGNYVEQTNPEATVGEVLGTQTIIPSRRNRFAAGLPYKVVATGNRARELPDSLHLKFRYNLYASETDRVRGYDPVIAFQDSLPNLAGKRITLSFAPATDADRRLIESYLPEVPEGQELDPTSLPTSLPGYLIKLKAQLKIDGEVVQSGGYFSLGQELSTASAITIAPGAWLPAYDKPIAGEFYAIGIDAHGIGAKQLEKVKARLETVKTKLENQQFGGLTKDSILGDILHAGILSYFAANDMNLKMVNRSGKVLSYRLPSFGTFSTSLKPSYFFGIPQRVKMGGIRVNIDFLNKSLWTTDNDKSVMVAITQQLGMMASAWEHRIPEMLFTDEEHPGEAVSAVKALAVAAKEGQRIYTVTAENVGSVLPVLNVRADVKDDIRNAVAIGKIATISQNQVSVGGWTGVGYIITDPEIGTGAYLISGGLNGGYIVGLSIGVGAGMFILGSMVELSSTGGATLPLLAPLLEALIIVMTGALLYLMIQTALSDNPHMVIGCFFSGFLLGLDLAFIMGPLGLEKRWQQFLAALFALIDTLLLINLNALPSQAQCLE